MTSIRQTSSSDAYGDAIEIDQTPPSDDDDDGDAANRGLSMNGRSSASPAPRQALSEADKSLAAYLLARSVDGREVSADELDLLKRANETVEEVRETLHLGRSNVTVELEQTGQRNFRSAEAMRTVLERHYGNLHNVPGAIRAAMAIHVGTGFCAEHGHVTQYLHMRRLKFGESVEKVVADDIHDHGWALARQQPSGRVVVMDSWGEGPAIDPADAKYMKPSYGARTQHVVMHANVRPDRRAFSEAMEKTVPALLEEVELQRRAYDTQGLHINRKSRYEPKPIIRKSFAKRSRAALDSVVLQDGRTLSRTEAKLREGALGLAAGFHRGARNKLAELQAARLRTVRAHETKAVNVALAIGADVQQAKACAGEIVDRARHLRRPGPSRVKEEFRVDTARSESRRGT